MTLKKGPAPNPIAGFAAINPQGDLRIWSLASSARIVRNSVAESVASGNWPAAYKLGWRVCPVKVSALGFEVYRGRR